MSRICPVLFCSRLHAIVSQWPVMQADTVSRTKQRQEQPATTTESAELIVAIPISCRMVPEVSQAGHGVPDQLFLQAPAPGPGARWSTTTASWRSKANKDRAKARTLRVRSDQPETAAPQVWHRRLEVGALPLLDKLSNHPPSTTRLSLCTQVVRLLKADLVLGYLPSLSSVTQRVLVGRLLSDMNAL